MLTGDPEMGLQKESFLRGLNKHYSCRVGAIVLSEYDQIYIVKSHSELGVVWVQSFNCNTQEAKVGGSL